MALEGGAGDFRREQEDCPWDKLPCVVLTHLCKYLHKRDHNHLGQLSKDMEYFIVHDFGIHVVLPPRDWNLGQLSALRLVLGRLAGIIRHVTDAMIKRRILNMEGKVIRSLNMIEMHPDPEFNPFPFHRLIQRPLRLREISLTYVDAQFLFEILAHCRNLEKIFYVTAEWRDLPSGLLTWLRLGTTFQPVPIPSENDNLIQLITQLPTVPTAPFHFARLTSLRLYMGKTDALFHSDWANLIFLLLVLPSQSPLLALKEFKFLFYAEVFLNLKDSLQIVACVAHFLAQCPHLQSFEYRSITYSDHLHNFNEMDLTTGLPQNVMTFLIGKYGSELLKTVCNPETLGWKDAMLTSIRQLMREAGTALMNLKDASLVYSSRFESAVYQELVSCLPSSLQNCWIQDYSGVTISNEAYRFLLPSLPTEVGVMPLYPVYGGIAKLCVWRHMARMWLPFGNPNRIVSLSEVFGRMRALKHLELVPRKALPGGMAKGRVGEDFEHDPEYYLGPDIIIFLDDIDQLLHGDGNNRIPDITIEEDADEALFQRVEVLKLEGIKFTTLAAARLARCRNLKELFLLFLPEHRHNLFGIRSGDLLRILGSLRQLEKVSVNMIFLPLDPTLKLGHCRALEGLGRLRQMRRPGTEMTGAVIMKQYKFLFCHN